MQGKYSKCFFVNVHTSLKGLGSVHYIDLKCVWVLLKLGLVGSVYIGVFKSGLCVHVDSSCI